jgi:hypothetical protein
MFYLSLPTAILSLSLAPIILPKLPKPLRPALDCLGLITMAIWIVTLLLAVTQGQRQGWNSTYIRSLFAVAAVFFVAFLMIEITVEHPFLDLGLYRNAPFVIASIAAFLYDLAFNSANFLVALMLQQVFQFTAFHAGLILAPGAVAMGLVGVGAGRLADLLDPRLPIVLGLLLQASALYLWDSPLSASWPSSRHKMVTMEKSRRPEPWSSSRSIYSSKPKWWPTRMPFCYSAPLRSWPYFPPCCHERSVRISASSRTDKGQRRSSSVQEASAGDLSGEVAATRERGAGSRPKKLLRSMLGV